MDLVLSTSLVVVVALVVPLGVRLLDVPGPALPIWLAAGALAGASVAVDAGAAALLAVPWAACALVTAGSAAPRLRCLRAEPARTAAAVFAAGSLAVAATALLVDRAGAAPLLGFDAVTWRLTALHFGVAGFAAALLSGLALVATGSRAAVAGCFAVPAGTALVALGHFAGSAVELAGAVVVAAGLLATSWATLRGVVRLSDDAGQLLAVAALITPATMALAVWWALAEVAGLPRLSLGTTAATHGVANVLGVGLAGVLGWTCLAKERL